MAHTCSTRPETPNTGSMHMPASANTPCHAALNISTAIINPVKGNKRASDKIVHQVGVWLFYSTHGVSNQIITRSQWRHNIARNGIIRGLLDWIKAASARAVGKKPSSNSTGSKYGRNISRRRWAFRLLLRCGTVKTAIAQSVRTHCLNNQCHNDVHQRLYCCHVFASYLLN